MSGVNNVYYIKGAVEEYIDAYKRKLEKLQKTIPDLDIERIESSTRKDRRIFKS